jgi:hypothetical protein
MKIFRLFLAFTVVCSAFSPQMQAVVPPPDGGYPNFNTAEGTNALLNLTTGAGNSGLGWFALSSDTTGNFNTGVGGGALALNNADSNTAVGAAALLLNTSGTLNTATGTDALVFNDTGSNNTAMGAFALFSNTASGNTAIGANALLNNTTGGTLANVQGFDAGPNVAVGWQALESNTVAGANTAVGYQALQSFTTGPTGGEEFGGCTAVGFQAVANATGDGFANSGFGYQALMNNINGIANTAVGFQTLLNNISGSGNTAIGVGTLFNNIFGNGNTAVGNSALANNTADQNTATGTSALSDNTTGVENTANGYAALSNNITGLANTAVGWQALNNNQTGNANVALGKNAGAFSTGNANVYIGSDMSGVAGESNACYIRSIFGQTSTSGVQVFINANNKLGTMTSSKHFKEDIKPMDQASQELYALEPVTFRYKKEIDPAGTSQFGLVAEDVEKVNPDLIVRDNEGKPYSVRYDQVNAMLLNEFLKEHKKVAQLETTVAQQRKDFEAALSQLKAQIQKVSAQLEVNKAAPQTVVNNQ